MAYNKRDCNDDLRTVRSVGSGHSVGQETANDAPLWNRVSDEMYARTLTAGAGITITPSLTELQITASVDLYTALGNTTIDAAGKSMHVENLHGKTTGGLNLRGGQNDAAGTGIFIKAGGLLTGIGTNEPAKPLHVYKSDNTAPLRLAGAGGHTDLGGAAGGGNNFAIKPGGVEAVRVLSTGKVGIGLIDPDTWLEVLGTTAQLKLSYDANSFFSATVIDASHTTLATGESGDLTLDVAGDIILDADGANVTIKDGGTTTLDIVSNGETDVKFDAPGDIKFDAGGNDYIFDPGGTESFRLTANGITGATIDVVGDLTLDADGGQVHIKDAGTSHFMFDMDNTEFVMYDDANIADYAKLIVGANGATTLQSVDASHELAHITLDADGDVILDADTGDFRLKDGGTTVLDITSDGTTSVTLDGPGDIKLSADGGNITMDDGTTIVFDFDVDNVAFKMMDDADTGDYFQASITTNGVTTLATNDDDGTGADLILDVDGDIVLDADGANITFKDNGVTTLDFVANGATDITLDCPGDLILDVDNADVILKDNGTTFGSLTNANGELVIKSGSTPTAAITLSGANATIEGNLIVSGTTTTVNSTVTTIDDPVFTIGGDTAPGSDDNKDRGIEFRYYDTQARVGFFGYDDSLGVFTGFTAATNSSEVFSGTLMDAKLGTVTGTVFVGDVTITANNSANETVYPVFVDGATGTQGLESDTGLTYNPSTGVLTSTTFVGALTGTASTAAVATTVTITDNESTNENNAIIFTAGGDIDGGNLGLESDGDLTYNPSTGAVTATTFVGALSGNATTASTATEATNVTAVANNSTDETVYPTFVDGATGTQGIETDTGFTYNPSSGLLTISGELDAGSLDIGGSADIDGSAIFNESGADVDFRVESDGNANMLFVDGGNNRVGIGTANPTGALHINSDENASALFIDADGVTNMSTINVDAPTTTTGNVMRIADCDSLTTGRIAFLHSNSSHTGTRNLAFIVNDNTLATGTTCLKIQQDSLNAPALVTMGGKVGIGLVAPTTQLTVEGTITLKEQATADGDTTAYGQLWVKNEAPNELWFTTDTGADIQLTDGNSAAGGGGGSNATTVTITDNESTDENNAIIFTAGGDIDGGDLGLESDGDLTYNPSTGTLTATTFAGALTGAVTGTATEATNVTVVANNSANETVYPTFVDGATGTQGMETDTGLTYNPSTGVLTSTTFAGTASVATVATTVTITDNESTAENNAVIFAAGGDIDGGNLGLESDGDLHYNPSTGRLTATQLAGTLQTAAQTNITSLGTLTTLTIDDITINGSTISDGGDLTIDCGGDIELNADGGQFNFKDNAVTHFVMDCDTTSLTIYDDTDLNDYCKIQVATDGETIISTNNSGGGDGHIVLSADGNVKVHNNGMSTLGLFAFANNNSPAEFQFNKSRGTNGAHGAVAAADGLGRITFAGSNGSAWLAHGIIECFVDGSPGAADAPGSMVFKTTPDGTTTPTDAMTIMEDGLVVLHKDATGGFKMPTATAVSSDMATNSGACTVNGRSFKLSITLDGSLDNQGTTGDIVVTNDKVLGADDLVIITAVSISGKGLVATIHSVATGSFKFNIYNASGGQKANDTVVVFRGMVFADGG